MAWLRKLQSNLAAGYGVRFGEAAVVSRRIHTLDPAVPQIIAVLGHADAGRAFYGRALENEVIHVDLFHAVGEADHRCIAASVRRVLAACGRGGLADFFDVQTGTGGGRITGDLIYGQRPSLLISHRNHIHIAGLLADADLDLLLPLVAAVEEAVAARGLQIRRIEGLRHPPPDPHGQMPDLSHYAAHTDSWLRGNGEGGARAGGAETAPRAGEPVGSLTSGSSGAKAKAGHPDPADRTDPAGTGTAPGAPPPGQTVGSLRSGALSQHRVSPGAGTDPAPAPAPAGVEVPPGGPGSGDLLDAEVQLQSALALARRIGSPDELKRMLDAVRNGTATAGGLLGGGGTQAPFLLRELEDQGLIRRDGRGVRLTETGRRLAIFFDQHLKEVKLRFRKLIRRVPRRALPSRPIAGERASPDVRYGPIRGVAPAPAGGWVGDLAVPETVVAGIRRAHLEGAQGRLPEHREHAGGRLRLQRSDLHVHLRAGQRPLYICLLIDASASMAGRRILAAKHLARHLLVSTRDRVAVLGFQERDVRVYVPFTRDYATVEEGLARIQPMGLTPLAHGLTASLDLIRESHIRRPLLLLITDGIPTVPKWTIDPLADAMEAARRVAGSQVPFGCIGLMPSRRYLEDLARAAGGTLHVVEELDEDALVQIAHRERYRQQGRL